MAVCMPTDGAWHGLGYDPRELTSGFRQELDAILEDGGASSSKDALLAEGKGDDLLAEMWAWPGGDLHGGFGADGVEADASTYDAWTMQQIWQEQAAWADGDEADGANPGLLADDGAWPPPPPLPGADCGMPCMPWGSRRQSAAAMAGPETHASSRFGARLSPVQARPKRRFCVSFPNVAACRRGAACTFAHTRDEIQTPLLDIGEEQQEPSSLTDAFFIHRYKTLWCPFGSQHEWHNCVYAHNYQDARRPVSIGYGPRLCPFWAKKATSGEYSQRCPLGMRCPYSHGAKEQLYHPHFFKTAVCRDLHGKNCPRHPLCAFFHSRAERRKAPADDVDYSRPLKIEALPADWVEEFSQLPFLPDPQRGRLEDATLGEWDADAHCAAVVAQHAMAQAAFARGSFGAEVGVDDELWGCWGLQGLDDELQSAAWFHDSM